MFMNGNAGQRGGQDEEDHDRTVHGDDGEVEVGLQRSVTREPAGEQPFGQPPPRPGPAQFHTDQHRQDPADRRHEQRGHHVLDADNLVVLAEDIALEKSEFVLFVCCFVHHRHRLLLVYDARGAGP
ncbi:MAG: hypothetical protein AUI83_08155 [Armatimonadetes bacterium 13_1_40CM_3_65_7]|nr:MAG: hypothetical protein AUI83_08155 [Armatimonadetes bacterium 13_1_40CM_3_65_7]